MQDYTRPTIDTYNKYAEIYDQEVVEFWENFPTEFTESFVACLPDKRVLDVGSGSGRDAQLLRRLGADVICVDASKAMVAMTASQGFDSHHADFTQMDFKKGSFDGIWAYTSLIHVPKEDAEHAIQKIRSFLKPDGIFAIGVIEGDAAGMIERKTMPGASRYFKNYSSQELKDLIEPLGFIFISKSKYKPHSNVYLSQLYRAS